MSIWTPERDDLLTALHAKGLSFAQIAHAMGGITRNSAIGRAGRIGLPARMSKTEDGRRTKPRQTRTYQRKESTQPMPPPPEPSRATAVTTRDIQKGQCSWPLNDGAPRWLHCGAPASDGPYCGYHAMKSRGAGTYSERSAV